MVLFSNRAVICARRKVRTLKNMYNVQCTWSPLFQSYPIASCLTIYMPGWPLSTCRPFPLLPVFLSSTCTVYKPSLSVCPHSLYLFSPSISGWPFYARLIPLYPSVPHFATCLSLFLPVYLQFTYSILVWPLLCLYDLISIYLSVPHFANCLFPLSNCITSYLPAWPLYSYNPNLPVWPPSLYLHVPLSTPACPTLSTCLTPSLPACLFLGSPRNMSVPLSLSTCLAPSVQKPSGEQTGARRVQSWGPSQRPSCWPPPCPGPSAPYLHKWPSL